MIIAGTGHRPDKLGFDGFGGYSHEAQDRLIDLARAALTGYPATEVISGMALGWDTALAFAARMLDLPYRAYIPFEGQDVRWHKRQRQLYEELLADASEVLVVSPGGFSAKAMQDRNVRMVDDCEFLLALWNGTRGGTFNCLQYARHVGCPRKNLWKSWEKHR